MTDPREPKPNKGLTRRQFIAAAAAAAALPGCGSGLSTGSGVTGNSVSSGGSSGRVTTLPSPKDAGFDHVVVVMMENRSFDHYLGWVPGAEGVQAGTKQVHKDGKTYDSYPLAPQYQNCDKADPEHSYAGGRMQINDGKMDGFLKLQPAGDAFPVGYYTAADLPFFKGCVDNWTICDHYFSGILASTTPNRIYMHAGQTDRISNSVDVSTLPTIWDRMIGVGASTAYYYTDVSYISFWGSKYSGFSKKYDMASFKADMASGNLANLTFVDNVGNTLNEYGAFSIDDHPYADIRNGQAFLNDVYDAVRSSPKWDRTLMIINYDEWGGFYDHVPPPLAPIGDADKAAGNDGRLGCRVPCVIIGPRAKRGHIEKMQLDPNSILNMLAWRFGFEPLGARASSNNIALALDFDNAPNTATPAFTVAKGPFGGLCIPTATAIRVLPTLVPVPVSLPVDVPGSPLPPIPIPVPLQLPSIPGFDVPTPGKSASSSNVAAQRLIDHEADLELLRQFAKPFGF